ncbi:MAG TPA: hypothetical protein VJ805_12325 [Nitrospiraceae bacterium]|nr:hypothetical protein [Nitrospiraceae bacterium]
MRKLVLSRNWLALVAFSACCTMITACSISPVGMLAPKDSSAWAQCGKATKVKLKAPQSTLTVNYTEPTAGTDGKPLENLAKTTIYVDAGGGPMIAKIVPATKPTGGGKMSEQVTLTVQEDGKEVAVCVTATDSEDREGPASP